MQARSVFRPNAAAYPSQFSSCLGPSMRSAVSLIEVLVVISIIVLLLSMLLPGLTAAREQARSAFCKNNLRQWGSGVQLYRNEWDDRLPEEGSMLPNVLPKPNNWFNALPPYLGLPSYIDMEGANKNIKEMPNMHVWTCPTKSNTALFKSSTGKNQFHYGMNQVLDGLGSRSNPSEDTPGFIDRDELSCNAQGKNCRDMPLSATPFAKQQHTVYMFDIRPNSPAGTPRDVGLFHDRRANVLYLAGGVESFAAADFLDGEDFQRSPVRWRHPKLYWGFLPATGK